MTGNTVVDALLHTVRRLDEDADIRAGAIERLQRAGFTPGDRPHILVTGHRRESFGPGIEQVCRALAEIALQRPEVDIVYPVHLNPNVQRPVRDLLSGVDNVRLIDPIDYEAFVLLMAGCSLVITDSGGIQEEAPSLGKAVLVTRVATERPEGVSSGILTIVGTDRKEIVSQALSILDRQVGGSPANLADNPYGDGQASERIAEYLAESLVSGSAS